MTNQDPILDELRIKPSMNGLVATVHGMPTNMTGLATGIAALISLTILAVLAGLGRYAHSLQIPETHQSSLSPVISRSVSVPL